MRSAIPNSAMTCRQRDVQHAVVSCMSWMFAGLSVEVLGNAVSVSISVTSRRTGEKISRPIIAQLGSRQVFLHIPRSSPYLEARQRKCHGAEIGRASCRERV